MTEHEADTINWNNADTTALVAELSATVTRQQDELAACGREIARLRGEAATLTERLRTVALWGAQVWMMPELSPIHRNDPAALLTLIRDQRDYWRVAADDARAELTRAQAAADALRQALAAAREHADAAERELARVREQRDGHCESQYYYVAQVQAARRNTTRYRAALRKCAGVLRDVCAALNDHVPDMHPLRAIEVMAGQVSMLMQDTHDVRDQWERDAARATAAEAERDALRARVAAVTAAGRAAVDLLASAYDKVTLASGYDTLLDVQLDAAGEQIHIARQNLRDVLAAQPQPPACAHVTGPEPCAACREQAAAHALDGAEDEAGAGVDAFLRANGIDPEEIGNMAKATAEMAIAVRRGTDKLAGILAAQRDMRGLSLRDTARAIGTSAGTLSRFENGQGVPDLVTIVQVAAWCGASLDELFGLPCDGAQPPATAPDAGAAGATTRCPECGGTGNEPGAQYRRCDMCGGSGKLPTGVIEGV